jgi:deoxycytidine triphosphate deaminase
MQAEGGRVSVLAKRSIERRLGRNEIFVGDSWADDCIRSAGYDIRVAPDYLIAPDGTRYWPDDPAGLTACRAPFSLHPGDVAFVSSIERLCMPLDLAGNIAQKFSVAREGLLVQCGLLVDPGYGMELRSDGSWAPRKKRGERLHFQLANIGEESFRVVPGKTSIAGIQFLTLDGSVKAEGEKDADIKIPTSDDLLEEMFGRGDTEPLAPLIFFPRTYDLKSKVEKLREDADDQRIELDSTRRSTEQLLVFGVFLVSITLFTVAVAALIDAIVGHSIKDIGDSAGQAELTLPGLAVAVVLLAVVGTVCWQMMIPVYRVIEERRKGSDSGSG